MQMLTSINCILHLQDAFACQHLSGEIPKFGAQLVIRVWRQEITSMTAHRMRVAAAVFEGKCHLCWLVGRHARTHGCDFMYADAGTHGSNGGVAQRCSINSAMVCFTATDH